MVLLPLIPVIGWRLARLRRFRLQGRVHASWTKSIDRGIGRVNNKGITATLLRHHRAAIVIAALIAGMLSYWLIRENPGYVDSGGVTFITPQGGPIAMFHDKKALLAVEDVAAGYMLGPQGEQRVRAAGGTAPYKVTMLNLYNEEYPDYGEPYITITAMSPYPEAARRTFRAAYRVLRTATTMLQERAGATQESAVQAALAAAPTGPVAQDGSYGRSCAALALLTIIATYMTTGVLKRWKCR